MARKRMLSPDIWESNSFSGLSDLAKLVFIGMISLSDDEGRGKANPSYIKSMLFPYDENRRVADVKSALLEIARCMSTQFYNVNGNDYYHLTNWEKWQNINRPTKSKLPAPPMCGEGEEIKENPEEEKITKDSLNTHGALTEDSVSNRRRIEVEEEKNRSSSTVVLSGGDYDDLCSSLGKEDTDYYIERVKAFLKKKPNAEFDAKATILKWHREDKAKIPKVETPGAVKKTYSTENLNAYFDNLTEDDL